MPKSIKIMLCLSVLLFVFLFSASTIVVAQQNSDDAWLAFISTRNGNDDLYLMRPDGSDVTRLTFTDIEDERSPLWSPNGRYLAYLSVYGNTHTLVIHDFADNATYHTIDLPYFTDIDWSPDNRHIIYTCGVEQLDSNICMVEIQLDVHHSNWHIEILTDFDISPQRLNRHTQARWIPGTNHIYVGHEEYGSYDFMDVQSARLLTINSAGDIVAIEEDSFWNLDPRISPDGAFIVSNLSAQYLIMTEIDGSRRVDLTSERDMSLFPAWSPDQRQIVFTRRENGENLIRDSDEIYILDLNTMQERRITNNAWYDSQAAWRPPSNIRITGLTPEAPTTNTAQSAPGVTFSGQVDTGRLNIRNGADADAPVIARISQGDGITVLGRNNTSTWLVIDAGVVGWVNASYVNTSGNLSALPVYSANTPLPASTRSLAFSCSGARGPSFAVGDRFVVPYGDGPTAVWTEPNSQPRVTRVAEGHGGSILGGPICTEGQEGNLVFWYVQSDSGFTGYMSEGYRNSPVAWIAPDN